MLMTFSPLKQYWGWEIKEMNKKKHILNANYLLAGFNGQTFVSSLVSYLISIIIITPLCLLLFRVAGENLALKFLPFFVFICIFIEVMICKGVVESSYQEDEEEDNFAKPDYLETTDEAISTTIGRAKKKIYVVMNQSHMSTSEAKTVIAVMDDAITHYSVDRLLHDFPQWNLIENVPLSDIPFKVNTINEDRSYLLIKRVMDIVLAGALLMLALPLLVLIAVAIYIDDPGPVLFAQMRVGRNNKPFRCYRFRSMVKNAPALQTLLKPDEFKGPIFKIRLDPRITRVGRILREYSLDELPQLVNVLRGDMSLVGPRPNLPSDFSQYDKQHQLLFTVKPGLINLREIYGLPDLREMYDLFDRREIYDLPEMKFERWIDLDLQYIPAMSFKTDLKIILRAAARIPGFLFQI